MNARTAHPAIDSTADAVSAMLRSVGVSATSEPSERAQVAGALVAAARMLVNQDWPAARRSLAEAQTHLLAAYR